MNIKQRLIWVFMIIILFPVLLMISVGGAIMYATVQSINEYYGADTTTYQIFTNPTNLVNSSIEEIYKDIREDISKNPEQFLIENYNNSVNNKLNSRGSFMVVLKNAQYVYVGNEKRYEKIKEQIPKMTIYSTQDDNGLYINDKQPFLLKKMDFHYSDGASGSVYVITNIETLLPQVRQSCIIFIISLVLIFFFVAFFLTVWIYQGMGRPLNVLRDGIYRMKNGDLDFTIQAHSDDEIGRICDDFEDMRHQVKKLMEERIQSEEQMKTLISNVSHDLKTPLTAIKGYTEGIIDGVADSDEKRDKYLKTIMTKVADMTYLVDELSFYSKINCNNIPYEFIEVNIAKYFDDCIEELNLDLEVKNIELHFINHLEKEVLVLLDPEQIKRVVNNIIGNSVKYMDKEKGYIEVEITNCHKYVQIVFRDNGVGVSEKDLNKIFERFYRSDQSRNSATGGSGLGLSIARKIIEEHGGKIWADGKKGKGLEIYFTLETSEYNKKQVDYIVENKKKEKHKAKNKDTLK